VGTPEERIAKSKQPGVRDRMRQDGEVDLDVGSSDKERYLTGI
jgi:hypothetical protein